MSDFIYCPVCDRRTSIDDASYFDQIPEERQKTLKSFVPALTNGDMVCIECEMDCEE